MSSLKSTYRFCSCIYNERASNAPFTHTQKYRTRKCKYCKYGTKYSLLAGGYNDCVQHKCDNIEAYCTGSVDDCISLDRLTRIMVNYVSECFDIECIDIQLILNDFLHLLDRHNILEEFEYVADSFGYCDIRSCDIVKRHYRQRHGGSNIYNDMGQVLKYEENMDDNANNIARVQILDTIHCYFNHTFDIGFRLRYKDKVLLSGDNEEGVTMKYQEVKEITTKGKTLYDEVIGINNNNDLVETNKFLLSINSSDSQTNVDMKGKRTRNEELMYSYGVVFEYDDNHQYSWNKGKHNYIRYVPQKYDTFKEEIANLSKIADIGNNEWLYQYKKAELHYNSYYCKAFVTKYNKSYNAVLDGPIKTELEIEHLLALMLYCNYDKLQYEFSKTYRRKTRDESNLLIAARHSNFYHLGKYMKEAVHSFGTRIGSADSNKTFYHGVSQQTVFSSASCAQFNGPLSTSTDYSVAACFANQNGLILELTHKTNCIYPSSKYFAMHWLSCYSNEHECLFIACKGPLLFKNIVSVSSGTEYKSIIKALQLFDHVLNGNTLSYKLRENDIQIAYKCISHQLNMNGLDIEYQPFETLQEYAAKLINEYFVSHTELWIDLNRLKNNNKIKWFYKILCVTHHEWINLDIINILFPNIECIYLRWRIQLNIYIMDNILKYLQNTYKHNQLKRLRIAIDEINSINIQSVIDEFKDKFELIGFTIYMRANTDLCIEKLSVINILLCD